MKRTTFTIPAMALLLGACYTTAIFTRTGDQRLAPRPRDCSFAIYTAVPPVGSVELGMLEFENQEKGGAYDLKDARTVAAPHVCAAGGDGLFVQLYRGGAIRSATIIKVPAKPAPAGAGAMLDQGP